MHDTFLVEIFQTAHDLQDKYFNQRFFERTAGTQQPGYTSSRDVFQENMQCVVQYRRALS
jgi:hypothetical protein